ncbi:hypothetical protein VFPPC_16583 [Pochonia chlamydosporia 170]|uniref:Uncharacterized protein n=1 Tax=Pochonia chlamydosporia 170 TaxID=1380566 RepID=A0A179F937_METCM|nr:hypothetical protein VFPPC_16583 [Pochonia chlamydosporia 170]OAQ61964.1 hypothetical protein VFPPC_16583 [Pochonia chlamydosporia 170]
MSTDALKALPSLSLVYTIALFPHSKNRRTIPTPKRSSRYLPYPCVVLRIRKLAIRLFVSPNFSSQNTLSWYTRDYELLLGQSTKATRYC